MSRKEEIKTRIEVLQELIGGSKEDIQSLDSDIQCINDEINEWNAEISELKEELKKLNECEKKIRHGDYGYYHYFGKDPVVWFKDDNGELILFNENDICSNITPERYGEHFIKMGNIIDELHEKGKEVK